MGLCVMLLCHYTEYWWKNETIRKWSERFRMLSVYIILQFARLSAPKKHLNTWENFYIDQKTIMSRINFEVWTWWSAFKWAPFVRISKNEFNNVLRISLFNNSIARKLINKWAPKNVNSFRISAREFISCDLIRETTNWYRKSQFYIIHE